MLALLASACDETPTDAAAEPDTADAAGACRAVLFEDSALTHCIADPRQHRIVTRLGGPNRHPFRSFAAFDLTRSEDAPDIAFAMNAGMFDSAGQPIGYYVEDGERRVELNRARGLGNFHLLPNGVFYGEGNNWHVKTSDDFFAQVADRPEFGTQSGPMLVINGALHPDLQDNGPSRHIRNGVGVDPEGRAHFVISEVPISFGRLARYFRDELGVQNALYLDGSVSQLWDPARERMDSGPPIGPLLVIERLAAQDTHEKE